jgi:dTDP-4-dehydrorhamnose reductase
MLGTDLGALLKARGHDVVISDRELDIADPVAVEAFVVDVRPTHIINCAAYTAVDLAESEEAQARRANADGPACLADVARRHRLHATHVSTDYVFPGDGAHPYTEDDAVGPLSAYGRTKLEGEQRFLAAAGDKGAVVRTSWLYGVHGKSFPATMLKLMAEREELRVVDDQRGRPTFTRDLARALADVSEKQLSGVFHFANAGEVTWHGFACAIRDEALARGRALRVKTIHAIPTSAYPTPAKRPAYSVLSTSKIEAALGWSPPPWREGLRAYLGALG